MTPNSILLIIAALLLATNIAREFKMDSTNLERDKAIERLSQCKQEQIFLGRY